MQTVKRYLYIFFLLLSSSLVFPENILSVISEGGVMFEYGEYDNKKTESTIFPMGLRIQDRYYNNSIIGITGQASISYPVFISSEYGYVLDKDWHLYKGGYDSAIIFGLGGGLSIGLLNGFQTMFVDIGIVTHYFFINNSYAEYFNFSSGLYLNLSWGLDYGFAIWELGLYGGWDLFSSSQTKLKNNTIEYKGGYNLPYFGFFTGVGFRTGKKI